MLQVGSTTPVDPVVPTSEEDLSNIIKIIYELDLIKVEVKKT